MDSLNMKKKKNLSQLFVNIICILICIIVVAPFLLVVTTSLTNEEYILKNGYSFFIRDFDISSYKYVLGSADIILNAYRVTFMFSVLSMVLGVIFMSMLAYPLSRKIMPGRKVISFIIYFTMLFNGGLVPTYILITKYLYLGDTLWVYILPTLISPWYVFMMRTSFQGIPEAIIESAYIDGASEFRIYSQFVLAMSKPVLATVALFTFLNKWNDWYTCMLYINDDKLTSLQYLLQKIIMDIQILKESEFALSIDDVEIPSEGVRMALAVVVAGPALVVFPFFQKYFTKGMTVGAVKG